ASASADAAPAADAPAEPSTAPAAPVAAPVAAPAAAFDGTVHEQADVLVLGAGPGGYTAAFRAADLGREVMLVERYPDLGGVCLNVGCIPSKALLHAAKVIEEAHDMAEFGVSFGEPQIDNDKLRGWKDSIVGRLTGGLGAMARQRKVKVLQGVGEFLSPNHLEVRNGDDVRVIAFRQCIIAAGSQSVKLPMLPDDPRVLDSTSALELENLPERMLVIGGGIIGLELGSVYDALGVKVSVVELTDGLMPGADRDMVRPLQKRFAKRFESIMLSTGVTAVEAVDDGLRVSFEGKQAPDEDQTYGAVLAAVGRRPNGAAIGADAAGVRVSERGFIEVDRQMRTNVDHIFAIGDIVGQPMLAHKATHEAKVAAEVACGLKRAFDARVIPSVAYTDPEVAWVGLTEIEARAQGIKYRKGEFPWAASGRSLAINRDEGMTKLLFDETTERLIGAGIVGPNAGDLIAEAALAIELGCDAEDIGLTVHPHPTLSETVAMAAEVYEGTITDLYLGGRNKRKA
ncbi:MAG: dihydrolipoyl dehydrogenase, partial [Pseudomonadota bacterium]